HRRTDDARHLWAWAVLLGPEAAGTPSKDDRQSTALTPLTRRDQSDARYDGQMKIVYALSSILLASLWMAAPALAQSVADFYRGRTMDFIVGYPPGAGFNAYGRALATYLGKYVPGNPKLIVRNMPGASSLTALKYLDTRAPRDGSVIGIINS